MTLRQTDENLFGHILDIDRNVTRLQNRVEIIQEEIHSLDADMHASNAEMQASIADLRENDERLAENIDETQGQLDALSSSVDQRFDDFNENYSEDFSHLNSTLGLHESQIKNLEIQDSEHSEAIIGINNELDAVKTRLSVIESQNQDSFLL